MRVFESWRHKSPSSGFSFFWQSKGINSVSRNVCLEKRDNSDQSDQRERERERGDVLETNLSRSTRFAEETFQREDTLG